MEQARLSISSCSEYAAVQLCAARVGQYKKNAERSYQLHSTSAYIEATGYRRKDFTASYKRIGIAAAGCSASASISSETKAIEEFLAEKERLIQELMAASGINVGTKSEQESSN